MTSALRAFSQALADFAVWVVAVPLALWLRFDFSAPEDGWGQAVLWGASAGLAHVLIGYGLQLYRGRYRFGSFDEVTGVVKAVGVVTVAWETFTLFAAPPDLPRTIPLLAGGLALAMQLAGRFTLRFYRERLRTDRQGERTLVYGAGDGGEQIVRAMLSHGSGYHVVGLIDDDPRKQRLRIHGVRVRGTICDLEHLGRPQRRAGPGRGHRDHHRQGAARHRPALPGHRRAAARHPQPGGHRARCGQAVRRLGGHRGGSARPAPGRDRRVTRSARCCAASGC